MRGLFVAGVAALVVAAGGVSSARSASALPCLPGELRATLKINRATDVLAMRVDIRNIGGKCLFQTRGAIVRAATEYNVLSKRGKAVTIPQQRTARLTIVWSNWCAAPGPSQVILKIAGRGKEFALPYVPGPGCKNLSQKTKVTVGQPALLPKRK